MNTLTITNGTCFGSTQEALDIELENNDILTIEYKSLSTSDKKTYTDFCNLSANNIAFEIKDVAVSFIIDRFTNKEFSEVYSSINYSDSTTSVKSKIDKFYLLIESLIAKNI
jgi:hypothetical protein